MLCIWVCPFWHTPPLALRIAKKLIRRTYVRWHRMTQRYDSFVFISILYISFPYYIEKLRFVPGVVRNFEIEYIISEILNASIFFWLVCFSSQFEYFNMRKLRKVYRGKVNEALFTRSEKLRSEVWKFRKIHPDVLIRSAYSFRNSF